MRRAWSVVWLLCLIVTVSSCRSGQPYEPSLAVPVEAPSAPVLLATEVEGISGLAADEDDQLWCTAERQRELLPLSTDGTTGPSLIIEGLPLEVDTESIAWIELPGRGLEVALGLEAQSGSGASVVNGRICDVALFEGAGDHLRLRDCLAFPLDLWSVSRSSLKGGIEGLCWANPFLVAALETPVERDGARLTAIAAYDVERQRWLGFDLVLTSDRQQGGKVSALECRWRDDGMLDAWVVERHFGLGRLLHFTIPVGGRQRTVQPEIVRDLLTLVPGRPNFEGLALLPNGQMLLVNDNRYRGRQGDTFLVSVPLGRARQRRQQWQHRGVAAGDPTPPVAIGRSAEP